MLLVCVYNTLDSDHHSYVSTHSNTHKVLTDPTDPVISIKKNMHLQQVFSYEV